MHGEPTTSASGRSSRPKGNNQDARPSEEFQFGVSSDTGVDFATGRVDLVGDM